MFEEGKYYNGIVTGAGMTSSKNAADPVLWFKVKTAEGMVEWEKVVTLKTAVFIQKTMADCFGMTTKQLSSETIAEVELPALSGSEVSVTVELKAAYKDGEPPTWVVQYLNPRGYRRQAALPETKARAAAIFASLLPGAVTAAATPTTTGWPSDADVPF